MQATCPPWIYLHCHVLNLHLGDWKPLPDANALRHQQRLISFPFSRTSRRLPAVCFSPCLHNKMSCFTSAAPIFRIPLAGLLPIRLSFFHSMRARMGNGLVFHVTCGSLGCVTSSRNRMENDIWKEAPIIKTLLLATGDEGEIFYAAS